MSGYYVDSPSNSRNRLNTCVAELYNCSSGTTIGQTFSQINSPADFNLSLGPLYNSRFVPLESAIVVNVPRFDFSVDCMAYPDSSGVVPPEKNLCRLVTVSLCVMSSSTTIVRTLYARRGMVSPDCPMNVEGLSFDNVLIPARQNLCVRFEVANMNLLEEQQMTFLFNSVSVIDF